MEQYQPVILSGGSGTRLWPLSRKQRPKPFLPLLGNRTLFQQAIDRVGDPAVFAPPIVVAGELHGELVRQQAPGCRLIVEPVGRNTAPAIALAASLVPRETIMLVCPSDHFIRNEEAFRVAVADAATLAADGYLVSIAVTPDRPATGFGYIRRGKPLGPGYQTDRFVEKPDEARAREFLASGDYFWNAGIFVLRAGTYLDELQRHRPDMAKLVGEAAKAGAQEGTVFRPDPATFSAIDGDSIDYAVMEHTEMAAMVDADMGWSDIGDFAGLEAARDDLEPQSASASDRHERVDANGVRIISDGPRVSILGVDDVMVVVDGDEVLVVSRDRLQDVGKLDGAKNQ